MSHDRGCWKCNRDNWEYDRCPDSNCVKKPPVHSTWRNDVKKSDEREPYTKEELEEEKNARYVLLDPRDYPNDPEDPRDIQMDLPARFEYWGEKVRPDEQEYDDEGADDFDPPNEKLLKLMKETPPWDDDYEPVPWKFNEADNMTDLYKYVVGTYSEHYGRDSKNQVMEQIIADGRGVDFCLGTIMKYCSRFGKKEGQEQKDVMKIMHYAILLKHAYDLEQEDD